MPTLTFATGNPHKVLEVQDILGSDYRIVALADMGIHEDIPETGATMHENALIKAQYVYDRTGKATVAEDSGLEVIQLNMEPGQYTARYAGPEKDHDKNIDLLLHNLQGQSDRSARFRAVVAYIDDSGRQFTFEGIVNGSIADQRYGDGGFGYDPVFIPYGYEDTFAVLPASLKTDISHRARAFFGLLRHLGR